MGSFPVRNDKTPLKPNKVAQGTPKLPPLHPTGGAAGQIKPDPNSWDAVVLAGELLPGHCKVSGGGIKFKLDPKPAHGKSGGKPTLAGLEVETITVTCLVWTDPQLTELERITAGILNDAGQDPTTAAFKFDAPQVRALGIKLVMIEQVSALLDGPERGTKQRTFTLRHFLPPGDASAVGTPTKGKKSTRGKNEVEKAADAKKQNPLPTDQKGRTGPTGEQVEFKETVRPSQR